MLQNSHTSISPELTDEDLEHYLLGRIKDQGELNRIESHLRGCLDCADRIQEMSDSVFALIEALQQFETHASGNSDNSNAICCSETPPGGDICGRQDFWVGYRATLSSHGTHRAQHAMLRDKSDQLARDTNRRPCLVPGARLVVLDLVTSIDSGLLP